MVDVEVVGLSWKLKIFVFEVKVCECGWVVEVKFLKCGLWISKINKKIIYFLIHLDKADISPLLVFTIFYKRHLYLVILSKKKIT